MLAGGAATSLARDTPPMPPGFPRRLSRYADAMLRYADVCLRYAARDGDVILKRR